MLKSKIKRYTIILNFSDTDKMKIYLWNELTLTGMFQEIIYLDHNDNIIYFPHESNINDIGAIWFNSHPGPQNNDKFSILLIGDAIKGHIKKHGIMTNSTINKYMATCNNVLLESMQGTEKPFVRISNEDELENIVFIEIT